jgi:hypothetical protein
VGPDKATAEGGLQAGQQLRSIGGQYYDRYFRRFSPMSEKTISVFLKTNFMILFCLNIFNLSQNRQFSLQFVEDF